MNKNTVYIKNEERTLSFSPGDTLLGVLQKHGVVVDAPCGGQGKCGKCRVHVEGMGEVLACRTAAQSGMVLNTSQAALEADTANILTDAFVNRDGVEPGKSGKEQAANESASKSFLQLIEVTLRPCPTGESISDWTRFKEGVSACCPWIDETALTADPSVISGIGPMAKRFMKENRSETARLYAALAGHRILHIDTVRFASYMAAFDIGTTTVAGYLLDAVTGQTAATASCMNPQARYGADVIARANYTLENGMEPVSSCIREALSDLLGKMTAAAGITTEDVYVVSVAGNTCMHHLFLGISVDSLVHAPYNPAVSDPMILRAADYDLAVNREALLVMLPNIAGFVGADTVACLVSTRLAEQKDWTLLIDIGTNGEMVLGKDHRMAACSTAAGPAFEGAGISCGMRGAAGAISKAAWNRDHWEFEVIGGGKVRGICGSGLLDITAQLLESGQMDETGDMEPDDILLADQADSATGEEIRLLKKDIRQLQLAKAAIATGVRLLAKKMNVRITDIREVWLAGAFGSFLSPESACTIGLIPPQLRGRIKPVGNAAGEGAKEVLLREDLWHYAAQVAREADFLELASMPEFNDTFIDEIMFPE